VKDEPAITFLCRFIVMNEFCCNDKIICRITRIRSTLLFHLLSTTSTFYNCPCDFPVCSCLALLK
jgi:hypothetical protein